MLSTAIKNLMKPKQIVSLIRDIDLANLERRGIKALLIDINDTIIPKENHNVAFEVIEWVEEARHRDFKVYLICNFIGSRERSIAQQLNVQILGLGVKPVLFFMEEFITKKIQAEPTEIALIGDGPTTDIMPGNALKFYTIMVEGSLSQSRKGRVSLFKSAYMKIVDEKVSIS